MVGGPTGTEFTEHMDNHLNSTRSSQDGLTMLRHPRTWIFLIPAVLSACQSRSWNANTSSLARDPNERNIAILFSSDPKGIEVGAGTDLKKVQKFLSETGED